MKDETFAFLTGAVCTIVAAAILFCVTQMIDFIHEKNIALQCDQTGKTQLTEAWYQCAKIKDQP